MMQIKRFVCNPLQENTYVVFDETRECAIIDCGCYTDGEKETLSQFVSEQGLKVKHLLCTHLHFDHIFGNKFIFDTYGISPEASAKDVDWLEDMCRRAQILGIDCEEGIVPLGKDLNEGDEINVGAILLKVLAVPGHSAGGLVFYDPKEKVAFVGDSIFCGSVGRTDLPGGNQQQLVDSLTQKVLALPAETMLLPGHGEVTNVAFEREHNPYLF
ncbi:MAG: MBL fold metallo-hydrolase [Bacteroidales bacterium]|jgi:glyoxylase-like metal-dependent hydrolase (beta-lactamase superfamily II)|nr:MBL fold metallo-hydrolase [Bacteroidales bacterium]